MNKEVNADDVAAYCDAFLAPCRIPGGGRQVHISDKTARQISLIIHLSGVETATIGGFVENVISRHLSTHEDVVKAMLTNPPVLKIPKQ